MKKQNNILYFIKTLIIFLLFSYVVLTCVSYLMCFHIGSKLQNYGSQEVMRIKIYGSTNTASGNTISATFTLMDSKGYDIATIERSWNGSYLAVEFAEINLSNKTFVFPSKIFGKNKIIEEKGELKKGTALSKYYNDNKQCLLLGNDYSYKERRYLYWLSTYATKKYPIINFGLVENKILDLSSCKSDRYYTISVDSSGNLFISEI